MAHIQELVVKTIPTEAPGREIGRWGFPKENRKVDKKSEIGCWDTLASVYSSIHSLQNLGDDTLGNKKAKIPMVDAVDVHHPPPPGPLTRLQLLWTIPPQGNCVHIPASLPEDSFLALEAPSACARGCLDVPEDSRRQGNLKPTRVRSWGQILQFFVCLCLCLFLFLSLGRKSLGLV